MMASNDPHLLILTFSFTEVVSISEHEDWALRDYEIMCIRPCSLHLDGSLSLSVGSLTLREASCHVKTSWSVLCSTEGLGQEPSWK